jgi:2',3'-cyclic-nucleotide 2'-phosphodiesterase
MKINVLCIGDVVGRPGRSMLAGRLRGLIRDHEIDCVIINAENAAGGSGCTPQIHDKMIKYGANLVTLGDHTYRKRDIIPTLETAPDIVRPANWSTAAPGKDSAIYTTSKGPSIGVFTLLGRIFMKPADCPYRAADAVISRLKQKADIIFLDFHAEATSEKLAMGYYLDGRVSCVFGTHTHVVTADECILPGGTAYITDIGMTGPHDSVLGRRKESVIKSFTTQMPVPFEVASGDVRINGILVTVDSYSKRAESIKRMCVVAPAGTEDTVTYDADDGKPEHFTAF